MPPIYPTDVPLRVMFIGAGLVGLLWPLVLILYLQRCQQAHGHIWRIVPLPSL